MQFYHCAAFVILALIMATTALGNPTIAFDDGWQFTRDDSVGASAASFDTSSWETVHLPHDWSIAGPIARENPMGSPGGFFPSGIGWYRKSFAAPAEWSGKHVTIQFDGVYMRSEVWINGQKLGSKLYGFSPFTYDLTPHLRPGEENTIAVRVNNSRQQNCRWYSGSGIYRHVWLDVREPIHITQFGAFVRTEGLTSNVASLLLSLTIENSGGDSDVRVECTTQIFEANQAGKRIGEALASFEQVQGGFAGQKQLILDTKAILPNPKLWSPQAPNLYVAVSRVSVDGDVADIRETTFGVRTIAVSAERGFELNGEHVELFGACIHDDNGPLGVAAFDRAAERRVELLKAAGFNAVRCSHNIPASAFLDACDRLGLLVINEAFDCWSLGKLSEHYAKDFDEHWQTDLDAMILRDRNHPSIIMWSLGNEIPDFGSEQGLRNGSKLIDRARKLDPTRFTTAAVFWYQTIGGPGHHWRWKEADPLMSKFDIVGYNYAIYRYEEDHERVPDRVMVGSESYSRDLFVSWEHSAKHQYVIGDFVWTGIDYLGESGIGRFYLPDEPIYFHNDPRQFPYHGAYCGDMDITGFRKPISHFRNIVWDKGEKLFTAVTEMTPDGRRMGVGDWGVVPSRTSWTWPGHEGNPKEVQVYSRYDSVRLYLNDQRIGEKATTREQEFKAVFEVPYEPGILRTAGVKDGIEVGENVLRTAGPIAGLRLIPDRTQIAADGQDLCFINVESVDNDGEFQPTGDHLVTFEVDGPATIAGVASGDYGQLQSYQGNQRRLFQGRAQVVVRSSRDAGTITVRASATSIANAIAVITAKRRI